MTTTDVVGLWFADPPDTRGRHEALRTLVAARAVGRGVRLLDLRPVNPGSAPTLTPDEQRLLEVLAEDGVVAHRPSTAELRRVLGQAQCLVVVADPARDARPARLLVDATWLRATPDEMLRETLQRAGQLACG